MVGLGDGMLTPNVGMLSCERGSWGWQLGEMKPKHLQPAPPLSTLHKPSEAARILRLHVVTLRKFAKAGRIPSIRLGPRSLRFDLNAVRAALATKS